MVVAEVITGLWIGWLARMLVLALAVAGQFIAYMLGVANVLQPDPELGGLATPIEQLFAMVAPLIILITGLYAVPLAALAGSYQLIPPGTMLPAADTAETAVRAVAAAFALALRIASPFLLVAIVWHVATGLLARLVPRLQVYFVVMPGTDPWRHRTARHAGDLPADGLAGRRSARALPVCRGCDRPWPANHSMKTGPKPQPHDGSRRRAKRARPRSRAS